LFQEGTDEYLPASKEYTSIETLSVDVCIENVLRDHGIPIDDDEIAEKWDLILQGLGNLRNLKRLELNRVAPHHEPNALTLAKILQHVPQIETLTIKYALEPGQRVDNVWDGSILEKLPNLKEIDFVCYSEPELMEPMALQLCKVPSLVKVQVFANCVEEQGRRPFFSCSRQHISTSAYAGLL
jgi:hypothetical protein